MGALSEIIGYLVQTLVSLYLVAMLLRFLLQHFLPVDQHS